MSAPSASETRSPLIANSEINACSTAVPSPAATSSAPTSLRPGSAHVRGWGVLEQVLLDRVAVEAGDGAQPAGDRRPRPTVGLHVPAEAFDVRPLRTE